MDFTKVHNAIPTPCLCCSATELSILHEKHGESAEAHWIYKIPANVSCQKCTPIVRWYHWRAWYTIAILVYLAYNFTSVGMTYVGGAFWCAAFWLWRKMGSVDSKFTCVPIPVTTVGIVERAVHGASTVEKGQEGKAHGTFIAHLANLNVDEVYKQSLCAWAPSAIGGYMGDYQGVSRKLSKAKPPVHADTPQDPKTPAPNVDPPNLQVTFKGNPDVEEGAMKGTKLVGDEYGPEERIKGAEIAQDLCGEPEDKVLAYQIGPDLIPTEVFQGTAKNLKAGLAKRVKPLPYKAGKEMTRKIDRLVTKMINVVFTADKIRQWRVDNPDFMEMGSKKWSSQRFRNAYEQALADVQFKIEHEMQIKINEALPANNKAPRPIIQSGDKGQLAMLLPVKCFEALLFQHFKAASIKGMDKHAAMEHFAKHMRFEKGVKAHCIEGDGSAWDACCNPTIRAMTENRIMDHIVEVLGSDHEVPIGWMKACMDDMKAKILQCKAKVNGMVVGKLKTKIRVKIEAIRQSGHRGTSAFNWLINYVCWMAVLCKEPEKMVAKHKGQLPSHYESPFDNNKYIIKYKFEGDDSAISSSQDLKPYQQKIEELWTDMGFRMKLIFGSEKLTFTGFNFLCDEQGPTRTFCPEVPRNIASSSWTTSTLVKQDPSKVHEVGAAAMMARAENFAMCGPLSNYFAQLGLAHIRISGDRSLGDEEAIQYGVNSVNSVEQRLHQLSAAADVLNPQMRKLLEVEFGGMTPEQECMLLACRFDHPNDTSEAKKVVPLALWDPSKFATARR